MIVVDLPEPFGPSSPKISWRSMWKSMPSTARAVARIQKSLKVLVRPTASTMVSSDVLAGVAMLGPLGATAVPDVVSFTLAMTLAVARIATVRRAAYRPTPPVASRLRRRPARLMKICSLLGA